MNRLILLLAAVVLLAVPALTDNRQEAVSKLEQDVKSSPNNPELWLHLGFAYRKADQIDQAQSAFQKTLSLDPNNREAMAMLALINEKKNQKSEAIRLWKNYLAIETDPTKRDMAEKHIHVLSQ